MRLTVSISIFIVVLLTTFFIYGERFETWTNSNEALEWLKEQGHFAGLYAILLLISDILFPIPATTVMAILGSIYGIFVGSLYAILGSMIAGLIAYAMVRIMGRKAAVFIAGDNLEKLQDFFDKGGVWAIAATRVVPIVPEVLCCLAGLASMRMKLFVTALLCGSIPQAFLFATLGAWGKEELFFTFAVATFVPVILLFAVWPIIKNKSR
ncbi:TVP38/TMEM64 family protein [Candidatus Uabimicrobium amorphum]|uniref:DedA family protein n=1 Tax=Uabimicrobium amorphum TaxID=2596890 RepID=A0A5S9IN68_UABAM|nr:VTT domain-containing protein [Candidatus Uabimicrobium amorphum]BBM84804.1 DedA family protein [Candidatus Uabimicrobium amorphum]